MEYKFEGTITSYKNYRIPFCLNNGHLRLNVSDVPSCETNQHYRGITFFNGKITFNEEYLVGLTNDGLVIKMHIRAYYEGEQCYGFHQHDVHFIYGIVSSCVALEKECEIDRIGFFSFDISKITGQSISGMVTKEQLKLLGYNGFLAEYTEKENKYYVEHDFLSTKPFVSGQVIAIKSDKLLSQQMMEDAYWTIRKFLAFIYQKKEVPTIDVVLFEQENVVGHLFIQEYENDNRALFGVKCLQVDGWKDKLSNLFQALVDKKIYLRHLPSFEKEKNEYTSHRFLMTVVGFESTLNICQIRTKHSENHQAAIATIREELNEGMKSSSGKKREEYKRLIKSLCEERFEDKALTAIVENERYIENFYKLGKLGKSAHAIANQIASSRNSFAHGNLEEDLNDEHADICNFLDLFILYLQLKYIGFSGEEASEIVPYVMYER